MSNIIEFKVPAYSPKWTTVLKDEDCWIKWDQGHILRIEHCKFKLNAYTYSFSGIDSVDTAQMCAISIYLTIEELDK
jgi:hypothetical protein